MALNIAVPLSGVGDLFGENFNLMSPLTATNNNNNESPNFDCRSMTKVLCSPIDSESSGISSLDSEEIKVRKFITKIFNEYRTRLLIAKKKMNL